MADVADTHNKIALFGKSAQRHLDALRQFVIRECQNLFDLTTKTCSVVFDAVREVTMKMNVIWSICMANFDIYVIYKEWYFYIQFKDNYIDGGEDYVTCSACTVNIGNAMCPKVSE